MRHSICILLGIVVMLCCHVTVNAQTLSLDEALEIALINNPRLKTTNALRDGIRAEKWAELLPDNPELFAEYEGISNDAWIDSYSEKKVGITQTIDFPVNYFYRSQKYNERYREASATHHETELIVRAEVTDAFYRVLAIREQIALHREIVQATRNLLKHARTRADIGEITAYEPLRVRVEVAEAQTRLQELESEHRFYVYHLKQLLGFAKNDSLDISGRMDVALQVFHADSLKQMAMVNHPVLRGGLSRVEQRRIDVSMSKMASLPGLSVSYFDQQSQQDGGHSAWGSEIALTIPIWDIIKAPARIRSSTYALEATGWELETMKRDILAGIEEVMKNLETARARVQNYQQSILAEVSELVRITEQSYTEGELGYLDVIDALRTMQRTRSAYLDALYQYHTAFVALETAVGMELPKTAITNGVN